MNTPSYPVIEFLVARGKTVSSVLCLLVLLACLFVAFTSGSAWVAVAGVAGAGVLHVLLLSYVEVLRIIADTLLPKY